MWIGSEPNHSLWPLNGNKMQSPPNIPLVRRVASCAAVMKLRRREPQLGPHPELLSFRCQQCGHVVTLVADDEH